jgi:hypothetical protein
MAAMIESAHAVPLFSLPRGIDAVAVVPLVDAPLAHPTIRIDAAVRWNARSGFTS